MTLHFCRHISHRTYQVDCNTLALVLGTKYKGAWDKINRAKKSVIATGLEVPAGAAGTPKKRKADGENGTDVGGAVGGGGKKKSPTNGGAAKAKKVNKAEDHGDDEESGLPRAKRVKKEASDEE